MKPILLIAVSAFALSACGSKEVATTFADQPFTEAKVIDDPKPPVEVVEKVKPLPLPGQLKKLGDNPKKAEEPADPLTQVDQANAAATREPVKAGYINAIQVYPFSEQGNRMWLIVVADH